MTDNEIIKALECCSQNNGCETCPYCGIGHCTELLPEDALGLINRQKAEIGRLNAEVKKQKGKIKIRELIIEKLKTSSNAYIDLMSDSLGYLEIKAEAIKEFAEKLKQQEVSVYSNEMKMYSVISVTTEELDNLVKEMVGDAE